MMLYLLESSLCWLIFYAFYAWTLSRETFFRLNRWYLLGTLALGALVPHLEIPLEWVTPEMPLEAWFPMIEVGGRPIVVVPAAEQTFDVWTVLMPVYWLGVAFASLRFLLGISQIWQLYLRGEKTFFATHTLVLTDAGRLPFSFGKWLFVSRDHAFTDEEAEKVIGHELAHIRGWHTADVLMLELACILLWWSPAVYLYRRSLRTVHEYLADHAVLKTARRKEYGHFLIRQTCLPKRQLQSGMQPAIANHFFHSQLKKRIMMMTKTKSGKSALLKYLMVFPLLVLAMLLFANREALAQVTVQGVPLEVPVENKKVEGVKIEVEQPVEPSIVFGNPNEPQPLFFVDGEEITYEKVAEMDPAAIESMDVLKGEQATKLYGKRAKHGVILITTKKGEELTEVPVDEMPRFPGCEELKNEVERQNCAFDKLVTFISGNLRYPQAARDAKVEGTVIVSFMVQADGSLSEVSIVKSIGHGTDEEVKRVVGLMPNWVPAHKNGKAVKSEMKLPVSFKLGADAAAAATDEVFTIVEELPYFAGCEDSNLEAEAKKQCGVRKMMEFITQNLKYPKEAREKNVQGTVIVQFIVDKNGTARDAKIVRGIGSGCDQEVLRIMKELPQTWVPGKQHGRAVNVMFTMPVKFQLDTPTPPAVGRKPLELNSFNASPNPASRQVRLSFEAAAKPVTIQVIDSAQKVVFEQQISNFSGHYKETISLGKAAKGMAFIVVSQEGFEPFTHKLAVQ